MDAGTAKKLIEKNLSYDEVKRLTVKLLQNASPQTPLLEAEPQVLALIRDVIKPELEASGLKPVIDRMGNLILHIKGRERTDRLMLVGYAMCAAPSTPIATPAGERAISELAPGDLVYSVDESGVVVVPILRVGSTPVVNHRVVRVALTGGAVLEISAGHPTADGRSFGDLLGGGQLDRDHAIISAEMVPYTYARTYDILPDSSSGTYFAAGALIGSTLAH